MMSEELFKLCEMGKKVLMFDPDTEVLDTSILFLDDITDEIDPVYTLKEFETHLSNNIYDTVIVEYSSKLESLLDEYESNYNRVILYTNNCIDESTIKFEFDDIVLKPDVDSLRLLLQ